MAPPRPTLTLIALVALLVAARPADACRCLPPSLSKAARAADVVFVGTIERVDQADHAVATVTVRAVWKGAVASEVKVHDSPTSCRRGLSPGETLVFVARNDHGRFTVRQCDGTQRATAAVERRLTRALGASRAPTP
ncbi:MAG: hypothetical protein IPH44_09630 [Myxococcales bacterium]|nr:hypothetical protein [Myxococcales bacterium]MBK7198807.1 hypothetical protein [Myxococcales bacterium]MBP6847405.1 hypothetical protein [Kofleriaceae bacterium]